MIQSTLNTDAHGQALLMYCIFMRHFIMPFPIEKDGCSPATSSDSRINFIAHVDTPPEMSAWEKIEAFFPQWTGLKHRRACGIFITHRPELRGKMWPTDLNSSGRSRIPDTGKTFNPVGMGKTTFASWAQAAGRYYR